MGQNSNPWDIAAIRQGSRVVVFVDGSNLYHGLNDLGWPTRVDIGFLAIRVAGDRQLIHTYYYNALPPEGRPHTKSGTDYIEHVKGTANLTYRQTRLQATLRPDEDGGGRYRSFVEKGADTALSTDIAIAAAKNEFDTGIIVSSDGDYEPTVRRVKEEYLKEFEVVFFPGRRPFVMESVALMRKMRRTYVRELGAVGRQHEPEVAPLGRHKWYLTDE